MRRNTRTTNTRLVASLSAKFEILPGFMVPEVSDVGSLRPVNEDELPYTQLIVWDHLAGELESYYQRNGIYTANGIQGTYHTAGYASVC